MKKVLELEISADKLLATATEIKKRMDSLSATNKEIKKTTGAVTQEYVKNEIQIKALRKQYNNLKQEITANAEAEKKYSKIKKEVDAVMKKEAVTIDQLKAKNKQLLKIQGKLNLNDEKQRQLLKKLNAQISANSQKIRENSDAETKRIMNIGNYKSALAGLNIPMAQSVMLLNAKRKALIETTTAEKGASVGARMLGMAMKSIPLIALLSVIAMLVKAFASTQEGMDAIRRATMPVKVVFETLWGVIQKVAVGMYHAFSNPKKALVDLYEFVKQNLINRFTALGKILDGIVHLDFKKMGDGLLQATTGVEDLTGKVVAMGKEINRTFDDALERGRKIAQLTEEIESLEQVRASTNAKFTNMIKEQELIAKDKTKSEQERADAMDKALSLAKNQLAFENQILKAKMKQLELQFKSNDTDREAKKQYDELLAQLENNKAKEKAVELRFLGVKNQIHRQAEKERTQAFKKAQAKILAGLKNEIKAWELKNADILKSDDKLTDELLNKRLAYYLKLQTLEKQALDEQYRQKFGKGYQNELEYQNAKLELEQGYQEKVAELKKQFQDQQIAEQTIADEQERQRRLQNLDLEIQELEFAEMSKHDKKIELAELQMEKEIELANAQWEKKEIDSETHERKIALIQMKYHKQVAEADVEVEKRKVQAKQQLKSLEVGMIHSLANLGTSLFGKNKAVASAIALIDTYVSAQKAYKSQMALATPDAPIRAALAAGVAVATGLANVANINKVQPTGSSGGSGSSTFSGATTPTANVGNAIVTVNSADFLNRNNVTANQVTNQANQPTSMRVVNVARDTTDLAQNETAIENISSV